jgi:hypothetical protein
LRRGGRSRRKKWEGRAEFDKFGKQSPRKRAFCFRARSEATRGNPHICQKRAGVGHQNTNPKIKAMVVTVEE